MSGSSAAVAACAAFAAAACCSSETGVPAGDAPSSAKAGAAAARAAKAGPILRAAMRRVRVIGRISCLESNAGLGLAKARQARREIAQGGVEKLGLLEMR